MALLSSCCCCCSVRRGSFASGCYTILYFFAFAVLTGNMAYLEIRTWLTGKVVDSSDDPVGGNYSSNSAASRDADARREGTDSSLEDINDNLDGTKFATTQAPPLSIFVIIVDFICELAGFLASIVLICGLIQERKSLLIPWMIIVPAHTALDIYTSSDILLAFFESGSRQNDEREQDSWRTFILLTAVTITAVINIYALLCVYSQYQEYKEGRGTAAHEEVYRREHDRSGYESNTRGRRTSHKGDIWCEEVAFKSRKSSSNFGVGEIPLPRLEVAESSCGKEDSDKTATGAVRFENETSSSSTESADTRQKLLPEKKSRGISLGGCENLAVPTSYKTGCLSLNLVEEQSTTADSIDEF